MRHKSGNCHPMITGRSDNISDVNAHANHMVENINYTIHSRERSVQEARTKHNDDEPATSSMCCYSFLRRPRPTLKSATCNLEKRIEDLSKRVDAARATALTYKSIGKTSEALSSLRRAKGLEKQLQTSSKALSTLETQILILEEANLQSEISSALSSSAGKVKKTTKGLLEQTEKAVDQSSEARDLNDDIQNAMEGLTTDSYVDEDDLLSELESMVTEEKPKETTMVPTFTFSLPSVPVGKPKRRATPREVKYTHAATPSLGV